MWSKLTIGTQIMTCVVAVLFLTLSITGAAFYVVARMEAQFHAAVDETVQKIILSDRINTAESDMVAAGRLVIIGASLQHGAVEEGGRAFRQQLQITRDSLSSLRPLLKDAETSRLAARIDSDLTEWFRHFDDLEAAAHANDAAAADRIRAELMAPFSASIEKAALRITAAEAEQLRADKQHFTDLHTRTRWVLSLLLALACVTGGVIVFVVRRIVRELRLTVHELGHGAVQVAGASTQVSASSQALAQGASEQAASLEETSASCEEVNSAAHQNAESTRSATVLVTETQQRFADANHSLDEMVAAMHQINQSSENISRIIKVIDEVAFQTNILALNAAVEAARAGEAGMGFAVVADEVRTLAQRCAQAARDTSGLIEESVARSHGGKTKMDEVATAIRQVTEQSGQLQELIQQVSQASGQQSRGMDGIAKAVTEMEQVTQRVAANAEESAAASEELSAQSSTLRQIAERLGAMVG